MYVKKAARAIILKGYLEVRQSRTSINLVVSVEVMRVRLILARGVGVSL